MKALSQPLFASLRGYDRQQLGPDLFSGVLIALLSIPISMGYAQLEVDETQVRTYDFLYSLTPQRYAEIKEETRARLVAEYAADASCWQEARDAAVTSVERLLDSVAANASTAYQLIVEVETPANVLAEAI